MTIKTSSALALCASLCLATPTYAQTPPSAPATTAPAATAPVTAASATGPSASTAHPETSAPGEAGKPKVKDIHAACREEAKSQGLKGMDMRQSVMACVVKQRPDLAGREQCRTDSFSKGLRKDELTAFVKDCAKAKS